jgi:integrase
MSIVSSLACGLSQNACAVIPAPRVERKSKTILDDAQAHTLIQSATEGQQRSIITLALNTGMREGEIFALTWGNVDLDREELQVDATLTETKDGKLERTPPKTKSSRRKFKLPIRAAQVLRLQRERTPHSTGPEALVFTDRNGGPLRKSNFLRREFAPLLKRVGFPKVTFHSLRHTAFSILINEGADPVQIARLAGHSTTRMTMDHYGHLFAAYQDRVSGIFDRVFDRHEAESKRREDAAAAASAPPYVVQQSWDRLCT